MRILCAIAASFGMTLLLVLGNSSHFRLVVADESKEQTSDQDEIKTQTLSELPGPRDRKELGIGEQVYCWIERPVGKPRETDAILDRDLIIWSVTDSSTMLPVITRRGDKSILTVALSDKDGQMSINATPLDRNRITDDSHWQAASPPAEPKSDQQPIVAEEDADEQPAWKKQLFRMLNLRESGKTPFDNVEQMAGEILAESLTDKDQAFVYFHLAELYAQSEMIHPDRVLEYSRRALALPLEPAQRTKLYIYRGDACLARRSDQTFEGRCEVARKEYFEGLKETSRHDLPNEAPERKMTIRYDGPQLGPDGREAPEIKALREAHEYNTRVDFQSTLIQHRKILWQQIKALHF